MQAAATSAKLGVLLQTYEHFVVDDYQRTYSWKREEISDLFNDLLDTMRSREEHFFGTLILHIDSNEAKLVDGQQRITTVFLLLTAIRDSLRKLGSHTINAHGHLPLDVLARVNRILYPSSSLNNHRYRPITFLQDIMNDYVMAFEEDRQGQPPKTNPLTLDFRKAISQARELVAGQIANIAEAEGKLLKLNDMLDVLLERFIVLQVTTTSISESMDIFLTLNSRGMPLGASDLVRGELMSQMSQGESDQAKKRIFASVSHAWETIVEQVEEPEVFLRHFLVSTTKEPVQKKRIFQKVTEDFAGLPAAARKELASKKWDDLKRAASNYQRVIQPDSKAPYFAELVATNQLIKSHRILAMTLMGQNLQEPVLTELIRLVFVLTFRWVGANKNAQILENFFQTASFDTLNGLPATELTERIRAQANFDVDIAATLRDEADSGVFGRNLLYVIDRKCNPLVDAVPLDGKTHLEHIAPKMPTDTWEVALLGRPQAEDGEYDSHIHQIGNLTLLDAALNQGLGQSPFDQKQSDPKRGYINAKYRIARDLENVNSWSLTEVALRTEWAMEAISEILHLEPMLGQPANFSVWLETKGHSALARKKTPLN